MKVLILSCNTGQGHNTAGRAIRAELESHGIQCEMLDALSFESELTSKMVCDIHTQSVLHIPRIFGFGVSTARRLDKISKKRSLCYVANATYATTLYNYIVGNGYDTVVAPHVFPSEALTRILRKYAPRLRTYFVATDYEYPPFLSETELDVYFIPHEDLAAQYMAAGIPRERLVGTGIPVSAEFAAKTDRLEARRRLGLPEEGHLLLVMTGSMGFGNTEKLVAELLRRTPADTSVVVMGGRNEKMKATLRRRHKNDPRLFVIDFTTEVSLYMDASDILFTKPGGLSSTEAAVKGIPTIHTKPIPGWEESNVNFFRSHGLALSGTTCEDLVTHALYLLGSPWAREAMVKAQNETINKRAAADVCRRILEDAENFKF